MEWRWRGRGERVFWPQIDANLRRFIEVSAKTHPGDSLRACSKKFDGFIAAPDLCVAECGIAQRDDTVRIGTGRPKNQGPKCVEAAMHQEKLTAGFETCDRFFKTFGTAGFHAPVMITK